MAERRAELAGSTPGPLEAYATYARIGSRGRQTVEVTFYSEDPHTFVLSRWCDGNLTRYSLNQAPSKELGYLDENGETEVFQGGWKPMDGEDFEDLTAEWQLAADKLSLTAKPTLVA